jgi:cell division protein FtsL
MDLPEMPQEKLTFTRFKDWAFLGVLSLLIMILVHSIYDLNDSVQKLSEKLSEKSGELSVISSQVNDLVSRVSKLEKE